MSKQNIVYVSIDIEADGPIPGDYSMLSLGAAAFELGNRAPVATFEANLRQLPEATSHPDTMVWWLEQPVAWQYVTSNQQSPKLAMEQFRDWLHALPGKPVFVGYPASFDQMWVHWYLVHFTGGDPMGFSGLDLKTLAAYKLDVPYPQATKRNMPKAWFTGCPPHTHKALDDAIGQGILFVNMMRYP